MMNRILLVNETEQDYQKLKFLLEPLTASADFLSCTYDIDLFAEVLSAQRPDLIITDLVTRDGTEFEVMELVKYKKSKARVIILTECREFKQIQKALRFGAADYILKSAQEKELLASIERVMGDIEEEKQKQKREDKGKLMHKVLFWTEGKTFLQSLLLGHPSRQMWEKICGSKRKFCIIMEARGLSDPDLEENIQKILQSGPFADDICICTYGNASYIILVICDKKKNLEWWKEKSIEVFDELSKIECCIRLGVSNLLEGLEYLPNGVGQAALSADRLKLAGISLYEGCLEQDITRNEFYVRRAKVYLEQHYKEKVSLSSVAENLNISQSYLSRLFPQVMHQTFSEVLTEIRVSHAIQMLQETKCSMEQISRQCGFCSVNYFYKIIKKQTGRTARMIRQIDEKTEHF